MLVCSYCTNIVAGFVVEEDGRLKYCNIGSLYATLASHLLLTESRTLFYSQDVLQKL
jgi:hypothetical protein